MIDSDRMLAEKNAFLGMLTLNKMGENIKIALTIVIYNHDD